MPFKNLSAKITGDSSSYVSATQRAKVAASDLGEESVSLASRLQLLQGRADEAGDEIAQTGRRASRTSGMFSVLTLSTNGLALSFGTLSTVATASLVPALALLATTLAPLTVVFGGVAAAAGSLAAVFGGLAATGIVTHMDALQIALAGAKTEIIEIISPLGDVFGPLLIRAVEALPDLVHGIVNSLGPLDQFRSGLVEFGQFAMEAIPQVTGFMFDLATGALPILNDAMEEIVNSTGQASRILDTLRNAFWRVFPLVVDFGEALWRMGGPLLELGTNVSQVALPALTRLADGLTFLMRSLNNFAPTISGAFESIRSAVSGPLSSAASVLERFAASIGMVEGGNLTTGGLITGISALTGPIGTTLNLIWRFRQTAVEAFESARSAAIAFAEGFSNTFDVGTLRAARQSIASLGDGVAQSLGSASEALRALLPSARSVGRVVGRTLTTGLQLASRAMSSLRTVSSQASMRIATLWNTHGGSILSIIGQLRTLVSSIARDALPLVRHVTQRTLGMVSSLWNRHGAQIQQSVNQLISFATMVISSGLSLLTNLWNRFGDDILAVVRGAFNVILPLVKMSLSNVLSAFDLITDLLAGDWEGAWNAIKRIVSSTFTGILTAVKNAVPLFGAAFDLIIGAVKDSFSWITGEGADTLFSVVTGAIENLASWIKTSAKSLLTDAIEAVGDAVTGAFTSVWNNTIGGTGLEVPGFTIDIPDAVPDIGGQSFGWGGASVTIPSLASGGFIQEGGFARLHAGERVVPAADVDRGGGVQTINIGEIRLEDVDDPEEFGPALYDELKSHGIRS